MMWIVVDWHDTRFFGPFNSEGEAENWLAGQNILIGQYEDNEVSINKLEGLSARLHEIKRA